MIVLFTFIYAYDQYDKIKDFYTYKSESYADLKKLNDEIIDFYQVDLRANDKLDQLSFKVTFNENLMSAREPKIGNVNFFWWILIGGFFLVMLVGWINSKIKASESETLSE
jgi:hypothetical protein